MPTAAETDKEQAILDAALTLFAGVGFAATPVPEIARKAGVGAGTIYRYFESKETLLNRLYRHWKLTFDSYLKEDFPASGTPEAKYRHFFRQMARFEQDYPLAFAFLEFHHHAPNLDDESRRMEARLYEFVHAYLDEARRAGAVKTDLPVAAIIALVFGTFTALVKARQAGQLAFDANLLAAVESCCWEAIRA